MMQISESYNQKNSLFNAMNRFIGAVNNMDQTVMVPSLLRDVPLDEALDLKELRTAGCVGGGAYFQQDTDMYSSYILLKSIRNDIEWGVLHAEERCKEKVPTEVEVLRPDGDEDDLQTQFYFHLKGLHGVLSKLTRQANTLTTRYKEEIGCRH